MSLSEVLALAIVAAAFFFTVRGFVRKKKPGCCDKGCSRPEAAEGNPLKNAGGASSGAGSSEPDDV